MFVGHCERNIDGGRRSFLILHFCFRQCGAAIHTPVNRFRTLIQEAGIINFSKLTDDVGFKREIHGAVRVAPISQHAQSDEILLLTFDLLVRIGATQFAKPLGIEILSMSLFHLQLNRQPMAVPARNVGCIEARQRLRFNNNILKNLVYRMANVNVAVGVWRAIMKDELWPSYAYLPNSPVALVLLPGFYPTGFALGQVPSHGEGRIRKIQCLFVVSHVGS